jgi:hypothetical protein
VAAALWPKRCAGLVSVNGYLIQDIAKASLPLPAKIEFGLWYQFYFQTDRGRAELLANRRDIARILWTRNSPCWHFDDATFDRSADAFDNPDYVDVVIHSYRHRLGLAAGYSPYEDLEKRLAAQPTITVPTITLASCVALGAACSACGESSPPTCCAIAVPADRAGKYGPTQPRRLQAGSDGWPRGRRASLGQSIFAT